MPMRRAICTRWMSVVPPGWTETIPLRCWVSRNPADEPHVGSVVSAAGPTASKIAPVEEPGDFGLDVDVGEAIAHILLLTERHPVALGLLAIAQQPVPHAVPADPATAAVLELEVRGGHGPA